MPSASLTFRIQGREADASEFADAAEQLVEAETRADHPSTCSLPHAKMARRGKRLCPKCKAPLKVEEGTYSEAKHPRGRGGKWAGMPGGAKGKRITDTISERGVAHVGGMDRLRLAHMMAPAAEPMTLHFSAGHKGSSDRMMRTDQSFRPGQTTTLRGHTSGSQSEQVASMFQHGENDMVHVEVPKGHPVYEPSKHNDAFKSEREVVLPHGTKVKITKTALKGGVRHHYGKVVKRSLEEARAAAAGWELVEAKDSMAKANSPEPFSSSKTSNWVARAGGLPPYIQHVAHDIHEKRGKTVSEAIRIAIGVIKNWAHGHGNVDAGTKAAAAKALAQWTAMKAKNAAKKVAGKLSEAEYRQLEMLDGPPVLLEAAFMRELEESVQARVLEEAIALTVETDDDLEEWVADALGAAAVGVLPAYLMAQHEFQDRRAKRRADPNRVRGESTDPKGHFKVGDEVRHLGLEKQIHEGVVIGFHGASKDPWVRNHGTGIERKVSRRHIIGVKKASGWAAWRAKHPIHEAKDEVPIVPAGPKKGIRAPAKQDEPGSSAEVESSGERVAHLQRRLSSIGFEVKPDGHFGPLTSQAVKAFQSNSMLKEDGVVGPATTAALKAAPHPDEMVDAGGAEGVSPDDPESGTHQDYPAAAAPHDGVQVNKPKGAPTLYKGLAVGEKSGDKNVRNLQADLGRMGYSMQTDGVFGPETEKTVKRFQRKYGLKPDGIVGEKTHRVMTQVSAKQNRLEEAVVRRRSASGSDFARAFAVERMLRQQLEEGWNAADLEERIFLRDRAGRFRSKLVGMKVGDTTRLRDGTLVQKVQQPAKDPKPEHMHFDIGGDAVYGTKNVNITFHHPSPGGGKPHRVIGVDNAISKLKDLGIDDKRLREALLEEGLNPAVFVADALESIPEAAYEVAMAINPDGVAVATIEEGKLSAKERDALPASAFAVPEKRAYPVHDEGHARAALSRVAQHGSPEEKAKVRAAVKRRHPKMLREAALVLEEANKGLDALIAALVEKGIPEAQAKALAAKHIGSGGGGAKRGEQGGKVTTMKRMPNGMFAPKGQGEVLKVGQKVSVPHATEKGTMVPGEVTNVDKIGSAHVTLDDGPDAGKPFQVGAKQSPWMQKTGQTAPDAAGQAHDQAQQEKAGADNGPQVVNAQDIEPGDHFVHGGTHFAALSRDADGYLQAQSQDADEETVSLGNIDVLAFGKGVEPTPGQVADAAELESQVKAKEPKGGGGWGGPEIGSKIKDKAGNEGEVTAHHDHSSGESDKKKFSVKHSGGEAKVSMGQLGDVLAGKKEWPAGKKSSPAKHESTDTHAGDTSPTGHDLAASPGRGPTGKLRNFKAMSPAKLKKTIADLEDFGGDPEALSAVKAVAQEKGVAWAEPTKVAPARPGGPPGIMSAAEKAQLKDAAKPKSKPSSKPKAKPSSGKPLAQSPTPSPQEEMGAAGAMGPNTGDLQLKDMPIGTTFQMNDGTEFVLHKPVNDPFMIAKPTQGGKAKPFHKMMAPPQVGPVHPDYGGDPSHVASSPAAPAAPASAPAASTGDLEGLLSASVDKAKAAKAAGQNPADAFKKPPDAAPAPSASAGVAESAALAAYKAAGGNDPAIIAALSKQK